MKESITFEQFCDPAFRREQQNKVKSEAVWASFMELEGLINLSKFAEKYFGKSQSWFAQKLHGNVVSGKARKFSTEEYNKISDAFRDLATQLEVYANNIDKASEIE